MSEGSSGSIQNEKALSGQKLKGRKFKNENLAGADFTGSDLTNARFLDCDLKDANFTDAKLNGARFEGGNFTGVIFKKTEAKQIRIKRQNWDKIKAVETDFEGIAFQKCEISNGDFSGCNFLSGAFFGVSILSGKFDSCRFDQVRSPDIKIEKTKFTKNLWKRSDLVSANILQSEFIECEILESDLSGSKILGTAFLKTKFNFTEMIACDFTDSTFTDCEYTKTVIKYSRGLSEEMLQTIKDKGGKVGRDIVRKITNFFLYTNPGRITFGLIVLAFVGFVFYRIFVPTSWSYEALKSEAAKAKQNNDHDRVKKYNSIIVERFADRPTRASLSYLDLAQVNMDENDFQTAETYFQKVLDLNKDAPMAYPEVVSGMGDICLRSKKFKEARKWFDMLYNGVDDEGYKDIAQVGIINSYVEDGQKDKALELIDKLLTERPDSFNQGSLIIKKVEILTDKKDYDGAIALLTPMTELENPDESRDAYFKIALIERKRGNIDKADEIFKEIAKKFPEAMDFVHNGNIAKAQELINSGQVDQGLALLDSVVENALNPRTRRQAFMVKAMQLVYQGRAEEAETTFKKLTKDVGFGDEDFANIYINYAVLKRIRGDTDEALKILDEVIVKSEGKNDVLQWAYQERANIHQVKGDIEPALKDLEKSFVLSQDNSLREETVINMIQLATFHGEASSALELEKKYRDKVQNPDRQGRIKDLVAQALTKSGDFAKAEAMYKELIESNKKDTANQARYTIELINAYAQNNEKEKGFSMFKYLAKNFGNKNSVPSNNNMLQGVFADIEGAQDVYIELYGKFLESMAANGRKDNSYYTTMINLADIYADKGEIEKSNALYDTVFAEATDENAVLQAYENLFRRYMNLADHDQAQDVISKLLKNVKTIRGQVIAKVLAADRFQALKQTDEALDELKGALDQCVADMDCCRVLDSMVGIFRMTEQRDELRSLYDKSKEKWSNCHVVQNLKTELNIAN